MKLRLASLALLLGAALTPLMASAQTASIFREQGELMRASRTVGALGADLFGDSVDMYTGKLSFRQTDVSLPGNNALSVAVRRTLATGGQIDAHLVNGAFGDWDLDIPHLQGIFAQSGWQPGSAPQGTRCTNFGQPPQVVGNGYSDWAAVEYWFGNFLVIPGAGSQEILWNPSNPNVPTGTPYTWPLTTKTLWTFRCLSAMSYGDGEGFLAKSPDGTEYTFDHMVSRPYPAATKPSYYINAARNEPVRSFTDTSPVPGPTPNVFAGGLLNRVDVWIMPSIITDRFGNWVKYHFDLAGEPSKVTSIEASDGRIINIYYVAAGNPHIASVSDGTHSWNYGYSGNSLISVTLPDNSAWQFNASSLYATAVEMYAGQTPNCDDPGSVDTTPITGTMTHPSGAIGTFTIESTLHSKSFVNRTCYSEFDSDAHAYYPRYFVIRSLKDKTISGPGLPAETWHYDYSNAADSASWDTCTGTCQTFKTVTVTDPRSVSTYYTFGNRHMVTEGQQQKVEVGGTGSAALKTTTTHYRAYDAGPYPGAFGNSFQPRGNGNFAAKNMPVDQRVITQQGVDFTWDATGTSSPFDNLARPVTVTKTSSLGTRSEVTAYADDYASWVLGQIASVTAAGKVMVSNTYRPAGDPGVANLWTTSHFGKPDQTLAYYPDGTLATRKDGLNQTTLFENYMRGIAQKATYADTSFESAVVTNSGNITSTTDQNGYTTTYGYDAMNRLNAIHWPAGDSTSWADTSITFAQIFTSEVGLDPGHWRQTISTGNSQTVNYFDALSRPRLTTTVDTVNLATARMTVRQFDSLNQKTFESYAAMPTSATKSINGSLPGTETDYDSIGRVVQINADSELNTGWLTTTFDYLSGFQKQITNPRGFTTLMGFQAFDEPSEAAMTWSVAPEDVTTTISRDIFGKPTAITRSGYYLGTGDDFPGWGRRGSSTSDNSPIADPSEAVSVTRSYVYDTLGEVLCKTVEPEVGATIVQHDAAGNLTWRATGLLQTGLADCDYAAVPAPKKITFNYDTLNRVTATTYGDGSASIGRTYYLDGSLQTLNSGTSSRSYEYDKRRLLTRESLTRNGGPSAIIDTIYDPLGNISTKVLPGPENIPYEPNALGQPTRVGNYATGISYFPNGSIAQYTLGNNIVHAESLNVRGLPSVISDLAVYQNRYTYDENGNTSSITDELQDITTTAMGYDGQDRLTSATSPNQWGTANYSYDALDNMRHSTIAPRDSVFHYTDNKLQYLSVVGQSNFDYGYDTQGNVDSRNGQSFVYDIGNRMQLANGLDTYEYDGFGRRFSVISNNGRNKFQMYDLSGKLMYGTEQAPGYSAATVRYVYLGSRLIAESHGDGTISYVHTDGVGSPIARSSNAVATPGPYTRYEPYGNSTAAGPAPSPIGFTGHVNDVDTGLTYMQQRYYDPLAGRFLSVDSITTDEGMSLSFGRYHYANNNPYKYKDPDGRQAVPGTSLTPSNLSSLANYSYAFSQGALTFDAPNGATLINDIGAQHGTDYMTAISYLPVIALGVDGVVGGAGTVLSWNWANLTARQVIAAALNFWGMEVRTAGFELPQGLSGSAMTSASSLNRAALTAAEKLANLGRSSATSGAAAGELMGVIDQSNAVREQQKSKKPPPPPPKEKD